MSNGNTDADLLRFFRLIAKLQALVLDGKRDILMANAALQKLAIDMQGKIALSYIRETAVHKAGSRDAGDFPHSYRVLDDLDLPVTIYKTDESAGGDLAMLPDGVDHNAKQGQKVTVYGCEYVVMENNHDVHHMALTRSDCVDETL